MIQKDFILKSDHQPLKYLNSLKDLYATDEDFAQLWEKCNLHDQMTYYHIIEGFLFKGNQLFIPRISLRDYILHDLHSGGLAAHTGKDKTIALVTDRFRWPKVIRDITKFVERCSICQLAKGAFSKYWPLYTFASAIYNLGTYLWTQ